jgi:hypothetical protein
MSWAERIMEALAAADQLNVNGFSASFLPIRERLIADKVIHPVGSGNQRGKNGRILWRYAPIFSAPS